MMRLKWSCYSNGRTLQLLIQLLLMVVFRLHQCVMGYNSLTSPPFLSHSHIHTQKQQPLSATVSKKNKDPILLPDPMNNAIGNFFEERSDDSISFIQCYMLAIGEIDGGQYGVGNWKILLLLLLLFLLLPFLFVSAFSYTLTSTNILMHTYMHTLI